MRPGVGVCHENFGLGENLVRGTKIPGKMGPPGLKFPGIFGPAVECRSTS